MTREEIEKIQVIQLSYFDNQMEEMWYKIGCIDGLETADAEPNLGSLWHDINDEPKKYPILCEDKKNRVWIDHNLKDYIESWDIYVKFCEIIRWAYISDLLPKGGEK